MNPPDKTRVYLKPTLRSLGRMNQVRKKTKPKGGNKNDPSTHLPTRAKPF